MGPAACHCYQSIPVSWSWWIIAPVCTYQLVLTGAMLPLAARQWGSFCLGPESVSGCKEWPVCRKRQGRPIWPPHSDWTVWQSGGGRQHHKDPPVCIYAQNLSVIVGDPERKEGIDAEGWEMEGQRGGAVSPVSCGWAGTGRSGVFSEQEGLRSSGDQTEMHQRVRGQSDRPMPESDQYRVQLKSGVTLFTQGRWATSTGTFGQFISGRVKKDRLDRRWILQWPLENLEMVRSAVFCRVFYGSPLYEWRLTVSVFPTNQLIFILFIIFIIFLFSNLKWNLLVKKHVSIQSCLCSDCRTRVWRVF